MNPIQEKINEIEAQHSKSLLICKQKIEWLEGVNKDLLEACKTMVKANTPETIDNAFTIMKQAILVAEGKE